MILELARRDQSVRLLWLTVPLALAAGVFSALVYGENSAHRIVSTSLAEADDRMVMVAQLTLTLGACLFPIALFHLRAHPHHLGLPLSTRQLWTARMIAMSAGTMIPACVGLATYFIINGNGFESPHVEMGMNFAALLLLFPLLYQLRRTTSNRADHSYRLLHWFGFSALYLTAQVLVADYRPPFAAVGPGCLVLGTAMAVFTLRSLPMSFEIVRAPVRFRGVEGWGFSLPRALEIPVINPFAPLNRAMRLSWLMTLNLVALALSNLMFINVALSRGKHVEFFMLAVFQALFFGINMVGLPMVAHLPISKTRLFAQCYGPGLLLAVLAAGIGLRADASLSLGDVLASRTAAAGFAVYIAIHFLGCAACLVYLLPPARTARGRVRGWLVKNAVALVAAVGFYLAVRPAFESMDADGRRTAELYGQVASWMPGSAAIAWSTALAFAVASVIGLRVLFGRIELTWLRQRMQKWLEKFA